MPKLKNETIIERKAQVISNSFMNDTDKVSEIIFNDELKLINYCKKCIIDYMINGKVVSRKDFLDKSKTFFTFTKYKKQLQKSVINQKKENAKNLKFVREEIEDVNGYEAFYVHIRQMQEQYFFKYKDTINKLNQSQSKVLNG